MPAHSVQNKGRGETLCELKCINACVTWFPRNPRPDDGLRAVDRRADGLTEVYGGKARSVDILYCGTPKPQKVMRGQPKPIRQIGPVETRLRTYGRVNGWVFGPWGQAWRSMAWSRGWPFKKHTKNCCASTIKKLEKKMSVSETKTE